MTLKDTILDFQRNLASAMLEGETLPELPAAVAHNFTNRLSFDIDGVPTLLGKGKERWGMAKQYATKIAPGQNAGALLGLNSRYDLEALDPKHRMSDLLHLMFAVYKDYTPAEMHTKLSLFFQWLNVTSADEPTKVRQFLLGKGYPAGAVEAFLGAGVAYFETNAQRRDYNLRFIGTKLYARDSKPFDTRTMSTAFSGTGWAIYVVSPDGKWYASSHKVGAVHHSSLLAGGVVKSAGEMQVTDGALVAITPKSGHYKPTMVQFLEGLRSLKQAGISIEKTKAIVYDADKKKTELDADAFLADTDAHTKYTTFA